MKIVFKLGCGGMDTSHSMLRDLYVLPPVVMWFRSLGTIAALISLHHRKLEDNGAE